MIFQDQSVTGNDLAGLVRESSLPHSRLSDSQHALCVCLHSLTATFISRSLYLRLGTEVFRHFYQDLPMQGKPSRQVFLLNTQYFSTPSPHCPPARVCKPFVLGSLNNQVTPTSVQMHRTLHQHAWKIRPQCSSLSLVKRKKSQAQAKKNRKYLKLDKDLKFWH